MKLHLATLTEPAGDLLDIEIVERKGLGHPDTICDQLAEELSLCLSKQYLSQFGHILHYNVDKALLWGGASRPVFGGGVVDKPMELFLAGRATTSIGGTELPLEELARAAVEGWLTKHMPRIEVGKHLITHCLVRPGSSDLTRLFDRSAGPTALLCNDTSCGLGYAPLSRLEAIVYSIEQELGALAASKNPEIGRDIKVMGVRRGRHIDLTIACAFISQFIRHVADYSEKKRVLAEVARRVATDHGAEASIAINAADDLASGSIYLTVLGTSAECGDDGQAGRGNRINGLITPLRPMTMESVAGKNAVTHVGKLYNLAAGLIAQRIVDELPGVVESQCLLVSAIGRLITEPQLAAVRLRLLPGASLTEQEPAVAAIAEDEVGRLASAGEELASGRLRIGGWPLRAAIGPYSSV